jgi:hypothetical protein
MRPQPAYVLLALHTKTILYCMHMHMNAKTWPCVPTSSHGESRDRAAPLYCLLHSYTITSWHQNSSVGGQKLKSARTSPLPGRGSRVHTHVLLPSVVGVLLLMTLTQSWVVVRWPRSPCMCRRASVLHRAAFALSVVVVAA